MNYEDERIKRLEEEKQKSLNEQNNIYDGLINQNQDMLNRQNNWQDEYLKNQNELFDRGNALINNQLKQKQKDNQQAYEREAIASESDYQKFINPYGVQAEQKAQTGMTNTGYSESTKLGAYNTSRMRTAQARSSAIKANTELDNAMAEAKLNNDSQKANLAVEILKQKLANELQAFNTNLNLQENRLGYQTQLDDRYYNRYQDVFNQQNYEKEQAENLRRYQEEIAYRKQQDEYQRQQDAIRNQQNWAQINASKQKERELEDLSNNSDNLSHISKEIINMASGKYGKTSEDDLIRTINTYYKKGDITANEVNYLLDYLGIE